ncbi:hypothetical protein OG226_02590 [Streptomyces sp. NBC_01261]|uniref:hypothetical protein n=1 Tax=Streptomyces sp. NBC_01261 TaxID=2903802 RepID=UPI002E368062|nr:hypothetical protein [Streptomyces sp. NBC_01261]
MAMATATSTERRRPVRGIGCFWFGVGPTTKRCQQVGACAAASNAGIVRRDKNAADKRLTALVRRATVA